jgi:hypothetical protein
MQAHCENHFTFAHYRFHLTPLEPLEMPVDNKGSSIQGGFGTVSFCCEQ